MPPDGKLHNVPCVLFSFCNDNIFIIWVHWVSGECNSWLCWLSVFDDHYLRESSYPSSNSYLGWIWGNLLGRNTWKVPRKSPPWKSLLKKEDSEVWRTTKVARIHQLEKQYATKIAYDFLSWCCCIVSWIDLSRHAKSVIQDFLET